MVLFSGVGDSATSEQSLGHEYKIENLEVKWLPILSPEMLHTDESAATIRGPVPNHCLGVGHMSLTLEAHKYIP